MAPNRDRRPQRRGKPRRGPEKKPSQPRITLRPLSQPGQFELAYPACVERRQEDLEEVQVMLAAGEIDLAIDELRWLLEGCRPLLQAHRLLGEIALSDGDLPLARAHFGYAYELGMAALPPTFSGTLPYASPGNQPLFESGKGLLWCLKQMGEAETAQHVLDRLLALDPTDPLGFRGLFDSPKV